MKVIKGASGFGDSIYLRSIIEWLLDNRPDKYVVLTKYPDVFLDLDVICYPFHSSTNKVDYYCSYVSEKESNRTQWEDMLYKANLPYFPLNSKLKKQLPIKHKALIIPPYNPMNGASNALPMKPLEKEFNSYINKNYPDNKILKGHWAFLELVKLFNESSIIISQTGWPVALAEMLDRPIIAIFTKRALNNDYRFIASITPKKIKTKPTTKCIIME